MGDLLWGGKWSAGQASEKLVDSLRQARLGSRLHTIGAWRDKLDTSMSPCIMM